MKSVVFIHPSADLYGSDKILVYTIKNFAEYSKIVILPKDGPLISLIQKECPDAEVHIFPLLPLLAKKNLKIAGIGHFFLSLFKFRDFLKKNNFESPDVLYLNTLAVTPLLFYFKKHYTKKIVHVHEILRNNVLLHNCINRIALNWADSLVCVSNAVLQNMEKANSKFSYKLNLVYNGVIFERKPNINIQALMLADSVVNFALIGRIKPEKKGQFYLLEALKLLSPQLLIKAHFYFVGSPVNEQEYMQDELIDRIKNLGLEQYVTIIPFMQNIEEVYQQIAVSLVPSTEDDSFPTTILESMYFERMVIGTRIGGIPEMIEDGVTGFLIERDDPVEFCRKIEYSISHFDQVKAMGKQGKKRFEQNFTVEHFNTNFRQYINDFLKN